MTTQPGALPLLCHLRARARKLQRLLRNENEVLLEVSDDGIGFTPHQASEAAGLGLMHIRDRTAQLNAELQIETVLDKGTTVRVSLLERGTASGSASGTASSEAEIPEAAPLIFPDLDAMNEKEKDGSSDGGSQRIH